MNLALYEAALAYRLTDDDVDHLLDALGETAAEDNALPPESPRKKMGRPRLNADREAALAIVGECGGNVGEAARRSGINYATLYRWTREETASDD